MRRKSDMWQAYTDGSGAFLPGEDEQAARAAAVDVRERLTMVEEQLRSQFTSMAAYAQIAQQSIDQARAEARADLDREKSTLVTLVERVRDEVVTSPQPAPQPDDNLALARIAQLEEKFVQLTQQFAMTLRYQEELANSVTHLVEAQMRDGGWLATCGQAAS